MCVTANPSDYLTYKHQLAATATSEIMRWYHYEITLFFLLSCFKIIPGFYLDWILFFWISKGLSTKNIFKVMVLAVLITWDGFIPLSGFLGNNHVTELDSDYMSPTWVSYVCSILCSRVGYYQFAPTFLLEMVWLALCCLCALAIVCVL